MSEQLKFKSINQLLGEHFFNVKEIMVVSYFLGWLIAIV